MLGGCLCQWSSWAAKTQKQNLVKISLIGWGPTSLLSHTFQDHCDRPNLIAATIQIVHTAKSSRRRRISWLSLNFMCRWQAFWQLGAIMLDMWLAQKVPSLTLNPILTIFLKICLQVNSLIEQSTYWCFFFLLLFIQLIYLSP